MCSVYFQYQIFLKLRAVLSGKYIQTETQMLYPHSALIFYVLYKQRVAALK
jgi:hypothetical protein